MNHTEVILLATQALLLLGSLYLIFFKSYFSEKGKNVATKEDIEEITTKVETIKSDFDRQTEYLRHHLQLENQVQMLLLTDLKAAITSAYENFYLWLETSYNMYIESNEFETKGQVKKAEEDMQVAEHNFSKSLARLELYADDARLNEIIARLETETTEFQNLIEKHLLELGFMMEDIAELEEENDDGDLDDETYEENKNRLEQLNQQCTELFNTSNEPLKEKYRQILDLKVQFRDLCYGLLTKQMHN
ncbi:MAG: hypothetical protein JST26_01680 [Bacteroidetes bacterium]|nr:hypothetical protein [Bacteroidota bacterium]